VNSVTIGQNHERAVIVPEAGCHCFGYRADGLEIVAGPPDLETWRAHPFRSGIPLLFPWPGRIAKGKFTYGGREIQLPLNETAHGHAIHGLTWNCAFAISAQSSEHLSREFDSASNAQLSEIWPFPFKIRIDYLVGGGLRIRTLVTNWGPTSMPFGFGAHPYFHVPLGGQSGGRENITLQVPSMLSHWILDENLIPTGELQPVAGRFDFRAPRPLASETYDDAFHLDPARDATRPVARLADPNQGKAIELYADRSFGEFVVFTPPGKPALALEPYTCASDAFNLSSRGMSAGMRELAPGASFEAGFEIRVASL